MADGNYSLAITANDAASAKLKALNTELRGLVASEKRLAAQQKINDNLSGRTAALSMAKQQAALSAKHHAALAAQQAKARAEVVKLAGGFRNLTSSMVSTATSALKIVPILGTIVGAASLAGVYRLMESWGNWGTTISNTAYRLGTTTEALGSLQGAAFLAGSSSDAMTSGLKALGDTMQDAVAGRAPAAQQLFNALGISINKSTYEAKSATDVLPELADKIAAIKNPTIQAHLATMLFGASGEAMLPFLRQGAAGLEEYRRKADFYGVSNEKGVKAADDFREANAELDLAVTGLGKSIAQYVGPVITPIIHQMSEWIAKNREWIAQGIGTKLDEIVHMDWSGIYTSISNFLKAIDSVVQGLGGWKNVLLEFFSLWALGKMISVFRGISMMIRAVSGLTRGLGAMSDAAAFGLGEGGLGGLATIATRLAGALALLGLTGPAGGEDHDFSQQKNDEYLRDHPHDTTGAPMGTHLDQVTTDREPSAEMRGMKDTIAGLEGANYNTLYGGKTFSDFSHHPGIEYQGPDGRPTSAAGRYQFELSTWNRVAKALNLKDFSPANQDKAADYLMRERYWKMYHRDLDSDLATHDPKYIKMAGASFAQEWSSTPLGAQPRTSFEGWLAQNQKNTELEKNPPPPQVQQTPDQFPKLPIPDANGSSPPPGPAGIAPASASPTSGSVNVHVSIGNAPPGTTAKATTTGNVNAAAPRVSTAMPVGAAP